MTDTNLQQLALALTEVNAAMNLTMLHGFMAGLATNPNDVKSDFVLKSVLGRDAISTPTSTLTAETLMSQLTELTGDVAYSLHHNDFQFVFFENDAMQSLTSVSDKCLASWCRGYLKATSLDDAWLKPTEASTIVSQIAALTNDFPLHELVNVSRLNIPTGAFDANITPDEKMQQVEMMVYKQFRQRLPATVAKLYGLWQEVRNKNKGESGARSVH